MTPRIMQLAARVVRDESVAVSGLADQLPAELPAAVRLLYECRGHVIVSGSGTSHAVALRFAHLLSCCGTPALFLHPGDSQHGAAGALRAEDVWIGLSKGGETTEVCFLAGIARKRGAKVIAITEKPASTLGRLADVVLEIHAPADGGPLRHDRHRQLALQLGLLRRHLRGPPGAARLHPGRLRRDPSRWGRRPQAPGGGGVVKAAQLTGPETIELVELPMPACPDDGVLLQVRACGVCGSDLRRWREGPAPGGITVPGHEFAGVVVEVGAQVRGYQVGDHLAVAPDVHCLRCWYCSMGLYNVCDDMTMIGITPGFPGGLAEYCVLPAHALAGGTIHKMPASLGFREGALAEPLSSVQACHEDIGTRLGDTVLVMGAGPIGCLHTAIAHLRGARVILSEPNAQRRRMAEPFAPELVIDPTSEDVVAVVREFSGGLGADSAICANPVAATHQQAVAAVRKRGTVVLFGGLPKAAPMTELDANRIHYDEIRVVGSFSYHPEYHRRALQLLERGQIHQERSSPTRSRWTEVDRVFRTVADGDALKVMVEIGQEASAGHA